MAYLFAVTVLVSVLFGFMAGLLTFKRSLRWCPVCGAVLRCPECAEREQGDGPDGSGAVGRAAGREPSGELGYGTRNVA